MKQNSNKNVSQNELVVDFGQRKISSQSHSKSLVLPKDALRTLCGSDKVTELQIDLVHQGKDRFIRLSKCKVKNV